MTEQEILNIIEDEAEYLGMSLEEALEKLSKIRFDINKIIDNELFDESKIRNSVAMAKHAFS